ncbi:MAG: HAMP domain-containing sensor histidine kinase [Cyclobacteriaceae bacterium]
MTHHKNSITLFFIISSIILLFALEVFWLKMEYEDELNRFNRETHMLLRNTVFELNDSLIHKQILSAEKNGLPIKRVDSIRSIPKKFAFRIWEDSKDSAQISAYRENEGFDNEHKVKGFVFNYPLDFQDELDKEVIEKQYLSELSKAGFHLPTRLIFVNAQSLHNDEPILISSQMVHTPSGVFKLEFSELNQLLLKNIAPQISFSIVLSLLVIGSFILLYRSLRLQQRLVLIKDDLISNISHELKTPITTVGVALEALRNFKGQKDLIISSEYISIAENELKRLTILTDKVLNASLGERNVVTNNLQSIDFSAVVKEAVQSFKLISEKNGATVLLKITEGDYNVLGDSDHLSNALLNLLDNALKYSEGKPEITIQLSYENNKIQCSIEDNGIGIAKEYHLKVFDKFFRVPTGDLHSVKGYGLGLSYVQKVIHQHKGKITLTSDSETGSTFIISLPRDEGEK